MNSALLVVDVQRDFCPGGALAVEEGDQVADPANQLIDFFSDNGWPIFFTRDWHPGNHCSFKANGGPWPPHCIADTVGAEFHGALYVPEKANIVSKATRQDMDAYSGFDGTDLAALLEEQGIDAVVVAGLATDYCVKHTALDAIRFGFSVTVVADAIRAVNVKPDDGRCAIKHMQLRGVQFSETNGLIELLESQ